MLHPSHFYHIYNHANGSENLFREDRNYYFFLEKASKFLTPYMHLHAYCLMPNHFHLLVEIREEHDLKNIFFQSYRFRLFSELEQIEYMYKKISKSLSNLFSCYTQSYNKIYCRKGSLFIPNFKKNEIPNDLAYCAVIHYIHANPVHHGFVKDMNEWKFSSFQAICSERPGFLKKDHVLEIFGGQQAFLTYQRKPIERKFK